MTPAHVTNEQILLLLDGEVTDSERRRIERHLTDCWNCRFRCEEMQSAIHHMVECRNLVVDYRLDSDPPSSRALLAARLEEQREHIAAPTHPAMMWLAKYSQAAFALAVGCVMLIATTVLWHREPHPMVATGPGNAQETLHQAIYAEGAESVPAGRVRHRSMLLRIRNVTRAVNMAPRRVDVWDDPVRHRSAVVDAQTRVSAVESTSVTGKHLASSETSKASLRFDGMLTRTLPAGFESLRVSEFSKLIAEPSQLSLTRDRAMATLLYQPHHMSSAHSRQPQILLARLDMRSVDLHPVSEELAIADDSSTWEFHLSEDADVDVPLADVPPGTFKESANLPTVVAAGEAPAGAASLDEAVNVLTILDGAGALTQQDVQLQRSTNGALRLTGVVQDDVRRQALLQLLQSDAGRGLQVEIATVAEQSKRPHKAPSIILVDDYLEDDGAHSALTNYFIDTLHLPSAEAHRKRVEMENQLVAWANDAESQAEALHEVLTLLPKTEVLAASLPVRREWDSLVQNHANILNRDLAQIGMALRPLSADLPSSACATQTAARQTDSTELLSSTRRISTIVSNFVAPTGTGSQSDLLTPSFSCLLISTEQRAARLVTPPPEP
jgi:hypothetical protein